MKWLDRLKRAIQPEEQDTQNPYKLRGTVPPVEPAGPQPESSRLVARGKRKAGAASKLQSVSELSPREREVFLRLLEGAKMRDIADELGIKTSTVNGYCREIYRTLGVNSKAQLIIQYAGHRKHIEQKGAEQD